MRKFRIGLVVVIIYVVAVIYVYGHDLLGQLYVLTFPWSSVFAAIADYYGFHTDSFNHANVVVSTICNASILSLVCSVFGRRAD